MTQLAGKKNMILVLLNNSSPNAPFETQYSAVRWTNSLIFGPIAQSKHNE